MPNRPRWCDAMAPGQSLNRRLERNARGCYGLVVRSRVSVLVAVMIGLLGAWILTSAASARPTRCTIQLRVNVFGASSPQSHWALQGGLNTGKLATLRAVSHGCNLHHITGRWVSGGEGAFPGSRRPCAGTVCIWYVRSPFMSAADFQAFGPAAGAASPPARTSSASRGRALPWSGRGTGPLRRRARRVAHPAGRSRSRTITR